MNQHFDLFLGEWLNEKRKALTGRGGDEDAQDLRGSTSHGWSDTHLDDGDLEDPAWQDGVRRPGEEYTSEEGYEDEWISDDDDDDQGGHMMPVPGM